MSGYPNFRLGGAAWLLALIGCLAIVCFGVVLIVSLPVPPPADPYPHAPYVPAEHPTPSPVGSTPGVRIGAPCGTVMQRTELPNGQPLWCDGTRWETVS